ncbi:MAG: 4-hydroxy-tetrahydrodipicolinate reductase [Erysipelotrichaceae bacterium]
MNIALVGYGTMNSLVAKKIEESKDLDCVGIVDIGYYKSLDEIKNSFDAIIDYSYPGNLDMIYDYVSRTHTPVVIATTGHTDEQINKIHELSKVAPVVFTGNFSLGITVMEKVLRDIAPILKDKFDIEVIEKHHNKKVDAPSGTAKMLVRALNPDHEYEEVYGRSGFKKREHEIGVSAIRGGTIAGEHTVLFAGEDEVLEITHEAHSKLIFVNGTITAVRFIINKPYGLYNMNNILFNE